MARGRPKKPVVEPVMTSETTGVVSETATVSQNVMPYCTVSLKITDLLNKKGISPVEATGSPMTYTYSLDKTDEINRILGEAGLL